MNVRPFLLNGRWTESAETEEVVCCSTGLPLGRCFVADAAGVESAVAGCARAFEETRRWGASERSELLRRTAEGIEKRTGDFVRLLIGEAGKPRDLAVGEVARAQQTFRFAAEEALRSTQETVAVEASPAGKNHTAYTRRFPLGTILGITPFNFPLNLVAHKVAPSIAAGNAILIKPSPRTPLTALLLGKVLQEAGCFPGQVNILPFHHRLLQPLYTDPRIQMVSFTGSADIGWGIKLQSSRKKVCLELGGNAACVVHGDSDWQAAIPLIATGAFGYAGQSCISVQRLLVQDVIYEKFCAAFVEHGRKNVLVGDSENSGVLVGPMIDAAATAKVLGWINEAISAGARSLLPMTSHANFLHPVILENVPDGSAIQAEEAFAPVVVLEKYTDFGEALQRVNKSRYGLQAGIFTGNPALGDRAYEELEVGAVLINQVPTFRVENMPYGGVKDSGFGREGVRQTMDEMSELKLRVERHMS